MKQEYGNLAGGGQYSIPTLEKRLESHREYAGYLLQSISERARLQLDVNRECFIAQWILQNTDKNIDDYVLCYCPDFVEGSSVYKMWMEKKLEVT